jgi:cobalamin biosynthesis Mg chelatase CobN
MATLAAETKRQDDLRDAADKYAGMVSLYTKQLNDAESRRLDEMAKLRAEYASQLSLAEAKRIDAIRAVDVNAVAVASQRAADQATVLATQVSQSAEALRALVASTAATVATSLQQATAGLSARLTTLEQASYQSQGKQSYQDPAFVELLNEVKRLRESRAGSEGQSKGVGMSASVVVGIISSLAAVAAIIALVVSKM